MYYTRVRSARKSNATARPPWNKGKIVGQKAPFKQKEIWAIRVRIEVNDALEMAEQTEV